MEREDSYKPGESVYYHEAGQIFQAKVKENKSDETFIYYDLCLLKQVSGPRTGEVPLSGLETSVIKGQSAKSATWHVSRVPKPLK